MKRNPRMVMMQLLCVVCTVGVLFAVGCTTGNPQEQAQEEKEAERVDRENQKQIGPLMEECQLSNVDIFWEWALDTEEVATKEEDATSRMVAFLLMEDLIEGNPIEAADPFLDREVDLIKSDQRYQALWKDLETYEALFAPASTVGCRGEADLHNVYPLAWKERGVRFTPGKAHLLSIVSVDFKKKMQYIRYAGVMLEDNEGFLLIEKRGEFKKFSISYYVSREELQGKLLGRKEFMTMKKAEIPFLMEDGELFEP